MLNKGKESLSLKIIVKTSISLVNERLEVEVIATDYFYSVLFGNIQKKVVQNCTCTENAKSVLSLEKMRISCCLSKSFIATRFCKANDVVT